MKLALYICIISICFTFQAKLKQVLQINKTNLDKLVTEAVQYLTYSEGNFLSIAGRILGEFSTTSSSHLPGDLQCGKTIYEEFKSALFDHRDEIKTLIVPTRVTSYNSDAPIKSCNTRRDTLITGIREKTDDMYKSVQSTYSKLPKAKTIFELLSAPTYDLFKKFVKSQKEYFEEVDTQTYFEAFDCEKWAKDSPFQSLYYVSSLLVEAMFKFFKCPQTHSSILLPRNEISDKSIIQMTPILLESFVLNNEYYKLMETSIIGKVGNGYKVKDNFRSALDIYDDMIKRRSKPADKYRKEMMYELAAAIGNGMRNLNKIGREIINKQNSRGI